MSLQRAPQSSRACSARLALSVCLDRICPDWKGSVLGLQDLPSDLKPPTYQG